MQDEILGNLFTSGNTIRIVQAYTLPSVRDSVPPQSALRFEPEHMLGKRRERPDSSPKTNGILPPPSSYKPNKRQRIADLNPDYPLPSLEEEPARNGETANPILIPNSQESVDLGAHHGVGRIGSSHVRPGSLRRRLVEETPPPNYPSSSAGDSADTLRNKSFAARSNSQREIPESSPVVEAPQRGRSASIQLQGVVESRRSGSAPKQVVQDQAIITNGFTAGDNDPVPETGTQSRRRSGGRSSISQDDVYERLPSGDEGAAVLKAKKAELNKLKHTPNNGRFNTPPSLKRLSRDRSTPGELPLTPNSRREAQRQKNEAEDAKRARIAAAEAAEQRRKESLEIQRIEKARLEEQQRLELDQRIRAEAAEQKRLGQEEEARRQKEIAQQASQDRRIEEGLVEAERVLGTEFELQSPEDKRTGQAPQGRKRHDGRAASTAQVEFERPALLRRSSSAISSTPYIPIGRKSAMKSSPIQKDASPALSSPSFTGVGIEHNMPLPKRKERKVSFHGIPDDIESPKRPAIRPQAVVTPHPGSKKKQPVGSLAARDEADFVNSVARKTKSITPDKDKSKAITPQPKSKPVGLLT